MGFGLLLMGYFLGMVMSLNIFGAFFRLAGFSVTAYAARKLSDYHKGFSFLTLASIISVGVSVLGAISSLSAFLYDNMIIAEKLIGDGLATAFGYARYGAELVFTVALCVAISLIAKETGEIKLRYVAIRNLALYCVYFVLQIICWLPHEYVGTLLQITALPAVAQLAGFALILLNLLMIFSCYRRICDESDVDMPQKPSRFEFVNQMRAEREEKEKARQAQFSKPTEAKKLEGDGYSDEQQRRSAANAKKKKRK
jgi:hypothetical protein